MRSLCVFIHYSDKLIIPNYVLTYIKELTNHFTDVILATNIRTIENIDLINEMTKVKVFLFKNEGYDFGLFYKSIHSTNISIYDRVAFINDSNILLKELNDIFEWKKGNNIDVWGVTDSYENVPNSKHKNSYHIQSHFIVFEKKSLIYLYDFFNDIDFIKFFNTNLEKRELWLKIIEDCEIGISQYMIQKGFKLGAVYTCKEYAHDYKSINLHMIKWKELLKNKYPLIKKKIITQSFDPVYEKGVAERIDALSAERYIKVFKNKNWKLEL